MAAVEKDLKEKRLYVRVSSRQREVISEAAEAAEKDMSAFVLDAALVRAQSILADRRVFALDEDRWRHFSALLDRAVMPSASKPRLEKLLHEPTVLEPEPSLVELQEVEQEPSALER
jgi:uncharacterized protein (DUF1778 family)